MKYIITKNRLSQTIYSIIDKHFNEIGLGFGYAVNSEDESEDKNIIEFYDIHLVSLFTYIKKEYYENLDDYLSELKEEWLSKAPLFEFIDDGFPTKMNKLVPKTIWIPVFKKWFEKKYELPIKTFV